MNQKPEALRLAEDWQKRAEYLQIWIDDGVGAEFSYRHEGLISEQNIQFDTAAELRRLHSLNRELVEALEELEAYVRTEHICGPKTNIYLDKARAAIAKARGEHAPE